MRMRAGAIPINGLCAMRRLEFTKARIAFGAAVVAALLIGASLGYAALTVASASTPPSATAVQVRLAPDIRGGSVGWCVDVSRGGRLVGGGCGAAPTSTNPLFINVAVSSAPSFAARVALTTSNVAAVSVAGSGRIPTHSESWLPYGFREATSNQLSPADWKPLDARGEPIADVTPQQSPIPLNIDPSHGPCRIAVTGLRALTVRAIYVAVALRAFPGIVGRAFESCADTNYSLHGFSLDGAILLDAAHPGAPPAPLPDMTPVRGAANTYTTPASVPPTSFPPAPAPNAAPATMSARRVGNAWLVVSGGSGAAQQLLVLNHLATIVK
jgi:hypothetical protein